MSNTAKARPGSVREKKYRWIEPLRSLGKYPHVMAADDFNKMSIVFVGFNPETRAFGRVFVPWYDALEQGGGVVESLRKASNASKALRKSLLDLIEGRP